MEYGKAKKLMKRDVVIFSGGADLEADLLRESLNQLPEQGTVHLHYVDSVDQIKASLQRHGKRVQTVVMLLSGNENGFMLAKDGLVSLVQLGGSLNKDLLRDKAVHFSVDKLFTKLNHVSEFMLATEAKLVSGYMCKREFPLSVTLDCLSVHALTHDMSLWPLVERLGKKISLCLTWRDY